VAVGVAVGLVALFRLSRAWQSSPRDFIGRYGSEDPVLGYVLLQKGYVAIFFAEIAWAAFRMSWLNGSKFTDGGIRLRTQIISVGWGFGVLEAVHEMAYAATVRFGWGYPDVDPAAVGTLLKGCILGLNLAGLLLGGPLASGWGRLRRWWAAYYPYQQLHTMWRDLYELAPHIAHPSFPPRSRIGDLLVARGASMHLRRRKLEIQDGIREIRAYSDEGIAPGGVVSAGEVARGRIEAATIADAVARKRLGVRSGQPAPLLGQIGDDTGYMLAIAREYGHIRKRGGRLARRTLVERA
jgi:hypothetical protein